MRALALALLLGGAACSRGATEPEKPPGPPVMSAAERERGVTICQKYVERVCACADEDACALARAQPEAVRLHLDVLDGAPLADVSPTGEVAAKTGQKRPPLNDRERHLTEESLRTIIAACVKLDAALDPATCPRR